MFDAIKRSKSLNGPDIRDALAATKEFPGVTGTVTFNQHRDAVKPIVMIEIKDGGTYAVRERVNVEGAALPRRLRHGPVRRQPRRLISDRYGHARLSDASESQA